MAIGEKTAPSVTQEEITCMMHGNTSDGERVAKERGIVYSSWTDIRCSQELQIGYGQTIAGRPSKGTCTGSWWCIKTPDTAFERGVFTGLIMAGDAVAAGPGFDIFDIQSALCGVSEIMRVRVTVILRIDSKSLCHLVGYGFVI